MEEEKEGVGEGGGVGANSKNVKMESFFFQGSSLGVNFWAVAMCPNV